MMNELTEKKEVTILDIGVYRCKNCGTYSKVRQNGIYVKAPIACQFCHVEGPFEMITEENIFRNVSKAEWEEIKAGKLQNNLALEQALFQSIKIPNVKCAGCRADKPAPDHTCRYCGDNTVNHPVQFQSSKDQEPQK
jgi:hypothetical protein